MASQLPRYFRRAGIADRVRAMHGVNGIAINKQKEKIYGIQ
jgi:hypothetical protein